MKRPDFARDDLIVIIATAVCVGLTALYLWWGCATIHAALYASAGSVPPVTAPAVSAPLAHEVVAPRKAAPKKKAAHKKKAANKKKAAPKKKVAHKKRARHSHKRPTTGVYTITFYCPCAKCCGKSDGVTASGKRARAHYTIAAPAKFGFGTRLKVEGLGTYTVQDRGGAIRGNHLDIFVASHKEALRLGRQTRKAWVVK